MTKAQLLSISSLFPSLVSASCGAVDYSWGASSLSTAHEYVEMIMLEALYVIYAIGAICCIVSSLQVYIKMNTGEEGVTKNILMVVGSLLFIGAISIVMPAFFGYHLLVW